METTESRRPSSVFSDFPAKLKKGLNTLIRDRRPVLILTGALVVLAVLAIFLMRPAAARPGLLTVRAGDTEYVVPGEEIFRNFNGSITSCEDDNSSGLIAAAPHLAYSDDMELHLDGTLFDAKEYVSVYTETQEPVSLDQDHLVVPAEAGTYLVRIEAFWGAQGNFVASRYYVWLDVPENK